MANPQPTTPGAPQDPAQPQPSDPVQPVPADPTLPPDQPTGAEIAAPPGDGGPSGHRNQQQAGQDLDDPHVPQKPRGGKG